MTDKDKEIKKLKDELKEEKDKHAVTKIKLAKEQRLKYRSLGFYRQRFDQ